MAPLSDVNHLSHPYIHGGDFSSSYSERKFGLMKWLSKLFKGGSNRGRGGHNHHLHEPAEENMSWRAPSIASDDPTRSQKQKELGHAMELSSTEDLKRPNAHQGYRWGTYNDEDYSKGLPDSLGSSAYPPHAPAPYYPRDYRICGGCNQEILHGNCLSCMDSYFHPDCFRCHSCCYPITEREFSLSGKHPYHKVCFKELTHPKCEVCFQFIPVNSAGLIEYRCHPFWSQKYCPSHEYDNTARCCSCERLEPRNIKYYRLEDGRSLCLECMESAIMDTGDCQPLYHSIRDYYEGMQMRIDQQVPMLLVEREALNEAIVGEKNGFHHLPETRGSCLSEEQTVTSVSYQKFYFFLFDYNYEQSHKLFFLMILLFSDFMLFQIQKRPRIGGRRLIGMRTQPHKLIRRSEVTAILVLYGLPRLLTGAILAHELMHAWLRLKGYRNLNPEVEEGICQVLSYMWLESEVMPNFENMPSSYTASSSSSSSKKGAKSQVENKLGEFFINQIVNDSSPAYGDGFRAANEAVKKYGLRPTLDHIRMTGFFPM